MQRLRLDLENQIADQPPALLDLERYHAGHSLRVRPRIREPEGSSAMGNASHNTDTAFVGIDVSKDTLNACLILPAGKTKEATFANDHKGHAALLCWADRHAKNTPLHFCMEATGPYSEAPATHLADAGKLVSVVNPTRIKYAGLAQGRSNKTDRADAKLIAEYAQDKQPSAWQPPAPEVRELQALVRRIDDLTELAAREKGRLASPALTTSARQSITRTIRLLENEIACVRKQADELIATTQSLSADRALLESIPGVGRRRPE